MCHIVAHRFGNKRCLISACNVLKTCFMCVAFQDSHAPKVFCVGCSTNCAHLLRGALVFFCINVLCELDVCLFFLL